jgi:hypothetical protein
MAMSLRKAQLLVRTALDKNKKSTVKGKPVYLKEEIINSDGKVVKTKIRRFPRMLEK